MIYNEDCKETLKRDEVKFSYVFTVPPDFAELDLDPVKDLEKYTSFLYEVFNAMKDKCDTITIAITDRKYNRHIIHKHTYIIDIFIKMFKWNLVSHKIWCKGYKVNLYRLNYTNIMTFSKRHPKQKHNKSYEVDVYYVPEEKYEGYPYAIPVAIVEKFVTNFTDTGDTVYDPFSGSGTTAVACQLHNRCFMGSEINKEYYDLSLKRLKKIQCRL
jgi:DNA modification methylase